MKFAKGRTQPEPTSRHMAASGVASAALQQSPLLRQQATQLMSIRQGAQPSLLRKQSDGGVSQQVSLDEEEPLQGKFALVQQAALEEEEPLQGKFALVQQAALEEEEPLQGKFATVQQAALEEEEPLQGKFALVQQAALDEEEPLQGKFEPAAVSQRQAASSNNTGMPDQLKGGIERLSGYAMDDVKVHYNSAKPAQMQAHAYAQGTDIHLAPGQDKHLPHEAWHVVQQKQGRVKPTRQLKGKVNINDDAGLEHEADVMGAKALQMKTQDHNISSVAAVSGAANKVKQCADMADVAQRNSLAIQMNGGREAGYYGRDGKKKSRRVIEMEEFGDRNRIHNLDPNKLGAALTEDEPSMKIDTENDIDKKKGIWRPSKEEGTARPEDPPIYQPFRKAFHNTHNVLLSMQSDMTGFDEKDYTARLMEVGSDVKVASVLYKRQLRSFSNGDDVATLKTNYINTLKDLTTTVEALSKEMIRDYKSSDDSLDDFDVDEIEELKSGDGEDIWRQKWWATVQEVNSIVGKAWTVGKANIKTWITKKREKNLPYMKEEMVGDLDYIGSLAKGYKSAPKQYLRFLPQKFDVDANLDAPPLAVYAIKMGKAVDRGSVKGSDIPPLKNFEDAVWEKLFHVPGIDKDDPFEVFIRADNVTDLMTGMQGDKDVESAQKASAFSKRFQAIQDRIWWLRSKNAGHIANLRGPLAAYITGEGVLKQHAAEPANVGEYSYSEKDLTKIELYLKREERREL